MRLNALILLFCVTCSTLLAQEPKPIPPESELAMASDDRPLSFWMEKKFEYSTAILKGLSQADFQSIEENARRMRLLSKVEGFVRSRTLGYRANLHTFERVADDVIIQAKKKNIDGVTLAYHQLTVSCVRCHQTLREANSTPTPPSSPKTK
ncbi:hypothetical protein Poly51_55420 [Rubripirellula tenax]|uniref:Cytochrome C n=1 Tax=Rubripirellula tenax TaxID=2528015 RepID=A0A5C6EDS3_9BACT|nr:hypothetical protein [Rubripirellula tenax]TWU46147.1 hypothetical protein Poly51_55420 [Rubripirellula tenax]